jgi:hypothetical protein
VSRAHLAYGPEPELRFAFDQTMEDPRDGLTLFGPLDAARPYGVRAGVIGTAQGIESFRKWVAWAQHPVLPRKPDPSRPIFPGFSAAFRAEWKPDPYASIVLKDLEIDERLAVADAHQRVYGVVSLYADRIVAFHREEEARPDLWFVVVPDRVKLHCRPQSRPPAGTRTDRRRPFRSAADARAFQRNASLFDDLEAEARIYLHEVDFHNQLKARLLADRIVTQGVTEATLANIVSLPNEMFTARHIAIQPDIAWRLSTAVYYKCGGRPWKLASVRPGVCYVGLVFKKDHTHTDPRWACCAAQMFLDSGDGLVFKGHLGPWHSTDTEQFHLSYEAAKGLINSVLEGYRTKTGTSPHEVFIHGKAGFNADEVRGFEDAAGAGVRVVGVTIKEDKTLKLYRDTAKTPLLRGTFYVPDAGTAHVWTRGYVPRLGTYAGWGVPNGLRIFTRDQRVPIATIVQDVLMLTKLNYNACSFADGRPVTLKFADAVGEILTAAPFTDQPPPPLPFRHYI